MYGYSGGGVTTAWVCDAKNIPTAPKCWLGQTSEVHTLYAPELKIAGAALGGLVPNMTRGFGKKHTWQCDCIWPCLPPTIELYNRGERAKLAPPAILGLSHDYPNMSTWIAENLIPETSAEFRKADSQCFDSNAELFSYQDIGKYFKRGWDSLLNDPVPNSVMHSGGKHIDSLMFQFPLMVDSLHGNSCHT